MDLQNNNIDKLSKENKSKLKNLIFANKDVISYFEKTYTNMFTKQLDIIEDLLTITLNIDKGTDVFQKIRKKILRIGNDAIRESKLFLSNYTIMKKNIKIIDQIDFGQKEKEKEDTNENRK